MKLKINDLEKTIKEAIIEEGEFLLLTLVKGSYGKPLNIEEIDRCLDDYLTYLSCGDKYLAKYAAIEQTINIMRMECSIVPMTKEQKNRYGISEDDFE
jgi:hypothetical protein